MSGEVAVDLAILPKVASGQGSHEDRLDALCARLRYKRTQVFLVLRHRDLTIVVVLTFHIVVAKLDQHVVRPGTQTLVPDSEFSEGLCACTPSRHIDAIHL